MMISCIRCGGLLVRERIFEANGMSSTERVDCERCLNCGAVEDDIVRANRQPAGNPLRMREPRGPRTQQNNLTALRHGSTDSDLPEAFSNLNFEQPYLPPARPGNRRGHHAHGQHRECDIDDGKISISSSSGGPE
jgi:hypothetical protein